LVESGKSGYNVHNLDRNLGTLIYSSQTHSYPSLINTLRNPRHEHLTISGSRGLCTLRTGTTSGNAQACSHMIGAGIRPIVVGDLLRRRPPATFHDCFETMHG
jgi:hypothetical protein